ncbi:hypothetical protein HMPREF9466_00540 [Fusobacterium necrophorum subsp. funduliforme 1_1_36S]|nr:hypothetical protein HMPREF9466_00540 [Fusobacterium necrophorum subsp. funduliforme 1_1_36S]
MYKLLNYGDFLSLKEAEKEMEYYSSRYHFDGYELIQFTEQDYTSLEEKIIGYHLRFFPSWMEFYKEDFFSLAQEYEEKNIGKVCVEENIPKKNSWIIIGENWQLRRS